MCVTTVAQSCDDRKRTGQQPYVALMSSRMTAPLKLAGSLQFHTCMKAHLQSQSQLWNVISMPRM